MYENIRTVGLPAWSEADQTLARALQRELGNPLVRGMPTDLPPPPEPLTGPNLGGGSDDIGDVSWTVPTVTFNYPSNIPDLPGHHWSNAVAMATPIAHKGATAGAKVMALTTLDLLLNPDLLPAARAYFEEEQGGRTTYQPFISEEDRPAIHLNQQIMQEYRPKLKKFYFDPARYETYLEQLGIEYPTVRQEP